jgi:hypothetical protein
MRRALAGGVVLGVLAFLSGAAAARPVTTPTRAQVQLMPLPKSVYGSEAASLTVDSGSGWTTNKEAADDEFDPAMTGDKLARMGRMTGFDVEFDDFAKASRAGLLVDADADVDLFRTQLGAARYYALELSEIRRFAGKQLRSGVAFDHVSYFTVPGLRNAQGIHFRIHAGGLAFWETGVEFRVGVLVAGVGLGRTDTRDVRAEARRLGTALDQRIHGVLAGKVRDKPLPQLGPKLGGLGRPPGGPDLSRMTILPIDFTGRAKQTTQRYVRNSDDVAEYVRHLQSVTFGSSTLTALDATVELRPTTKAATDFVAVQRSIFQGQRGLAYLRKALASGVPPNVRKNIRFSGLSLTTVTAGDEAFAYTATMKVLSTHVRVQFAFCEVRRGAVVETLTLVGKPNESVARLDVVRAARTAAARIDLALHG